MVLLANTITADMGLIPGLAFVGPAMGLPLSVLAAFVERPFYSLAGVRRNAIWFSLQANLVSLGVGFIATLIFMFFSDAMRYWYAPFEVWPFGAVCVSILVERAYLQRRTRANVRWAWTILANVLSAGMCVALLFLVLYLRQEAPELRRVLTPYRGPLQLFALGGSVVLFIIAFARTRTLVQPSESIEPLVAT